MTSSSNRAAVPEAKGALDKFKYEVANELGVPLTDRYKFHRRHLLYKIFVKKCRER